MPNKKHEPCHWQYHVIRCVYGGLPAQRIRRLDGGGQNCGVATENLAAFSISLICLVRSLLLGLTANTVNGHFNMCMGLLHLLA